MSEQRLEVTPFVKRLSEIIAVRIMEVMQAKWPNMDLDGSVRVLGRLHPPGVTVPLYPEEAVVFQAEKVDYSKAMILTETVSLHKLGLIIRLGYGPKSKTFVIQPSEHMFRHLEEMYEQDE